MCHSNDTPVTWTSSHIPVILCRISGTTDVIDASVVLCARARGHRIATTDPDGLRRLDSRTPLIRV